MNEKCDAGLCDKQFVVFIKKQTRIFVKRPRLDQGQEFDAWDLKFWTKKKKIKDELIMAYSLKMNDIAELTNGLVASKARCLLLNTLPKMG